MGFCKNGNGKNEEENLTHFSFGQFFLGFFRVLKNPIIAEKSSVSLFEIKLMLFGFRKRLNSWVMGIVLKVIDSERKKNIA